ncbi:hypothetical protein K443DRAFT_15728 [Laccaria amethystina LaAM-08-1]|uniref:Uncharacterized protein n=1 Tax=Laccaria amethystina LaAM-08-1 TaxID=1095629 RepID=A0A0C9WZU4_9AGAR|nr:hypothetical protein K443DRAFT_15728 [Laccaria amethystina LaAM-08-1]
MRVMLGPSWSLLPSDFLLSTFSTPFRLIPLSLRDHRSLQTQMALGAIIIVSPFLWSHSDRRVFTIRVILGLGFPSCLGFSLHNPGIKDRALGDYRCAPLHLVEGRIR